MKRIKQIGIAFGAMACVLIIGLFALEFVIDLTPYRAQITKPISDALHRKVEIGKISHTLLRGPGASLQDVAIFEADQSAIWAQTKEIMAKLKLLPLLSKRIEVAKISLNQPEIVLKRSRDGAWNIGDLFGQPAEAAPLPSDASRPPAAASTPKQDEQPAKATPTAPSPQPSKTAASPTFAIDAVQLTDGKIRIVDDLLTVTTDVTDVNAQVRGISADSPIRFDLSAGLDGGKSGQIDTSGKLGPFPADGSMLNLDMDVTAKLKEVDLAHFQPYLQMAKLQGKKDLPPSGKLNATLQVAGNTGKKVTSSGSVSVGDVKVDVAGDVEQPAASPKFDLTISSKEFPWEKLIELLPPNVARELKNLGLTGVGTLKVQPKGDLANLAISGEFDLSKSGVRYQNIFSKPEAVPMTLTIQAVLKADALELTAVKLAFGSVALDVTGSVSHFDAPALDLQVASNAFSLPDFLARFPEVAALKKDGQPALKSNGEASLKARVKGAVDDLAIAATLTLDQSDVAYADLFAKGAKIPGNIDFEGRVRKDALAVTRCVVNLGDLQLTAQGTMTNFKTPKFDASVETNLFDMTALLGRFPISKASLPKELRLDGMGKILLKPTGTAENLTISGVVDLTKGSLQFGESFAKPKDMPGKIEFETAITPDAVNFKSVRLNLNDVLIDITGAISGLKKEAMLDLTISSEQFALNQLLPLSGMEMTPTGSTELRLRVKGPLAKLDAKSLVAADVRCADVAFLAPGLNKPVSRLNFLAKLKDQMLTVQQLSGTVGESTLEGELSIADVFTLPNMTFTLSSPQLNLDELLASARTPQPSAFRFAAATKSEPLPAKPGWPLSVLTANGMLTVAQGVIKQVQFTDLRAEIAFAKQKLNIEPLQFSLYDGDYEGRAQFDLTAPNPQYVFESKLVNVDSNQLLTASASAKDVVYGMLFADASVAGQGFSPKQIAQNLSGKGAVKIESGKFASFDIWQNIGQVFELLGSVGQSDELRQIGADFSRFPNETNFSRFEAAFDLKNGEGGTSEITLAIPEQDMNIALLMNGTFGLDMSLDFLGKIRFMPESKYYQDMKKTFSDFEQADGSIELPFPIPIGGTLMKPTVNLKSVEKSVVAFAKELLKQSAKSEIKEQLEKEGQNLLEQIFK